MNLDSRSRWFMEDAERFPKEIMDEFQQLQSVPRGIAYLHLCKLAIEAFTNGDYPYKHIPEFSMEAWLVSEEVNKRNKKAAKAEEQPADEPITESENTPEVVGEGYDEDGVPKAALAEEMVLEVLAGGDVLSNKEILCRIAEGGRISDDALNVMDKRRPRYESRVRWAIEKLYKEDGFIDKVETGMYVINARGITRCREIGLIEAVQTIAPYGKDDFLREVYMREADMKALVSQLRRKMNIILQGAPGTGKTYAAKRLAYLMMGQRDDSRIKIVQFHQSTAYDDFVCGYRPVEGGGYEPRAGVFVQFCRKAASDPGRDYFFIIDEINRANISKVFGELLMLIEKEHREDKITLALNNEQFSVPRNVYVIGMMNTADRGLALIDYALRRRFAFFEMKPALENPAFRAAVEEAGGSKLIALVDAVIDLNDTIAADPALGRGFRIGHSYFCDDGSEDDVVQAIIRFEIAPLLEEYWFDDLERAETEIRRLEDAARESDEQ